jgi:hypothetical protein
MSLTLVTGFAVVVGVTAVCIGVGWLRTPLRVHEFQVTYLGSTRRSEPVVRRGSLVRGFVLVVLGCLCLLFAVISV